MDPKRNYEDQYRRSAPTPKLRLAGRIDGEIDGRPVRLITEKQSMILTMGSLRTLLSIRSSSRSFIQPLRAFLKRSDIRLLFRITWLGRVEVLPNPPFLVRMLLPRKLC